MTELIFFGIGSNSFGDLNTVSFGVRDSDEQGKWLLMDCGPTIPKQVRKAGIKFLDISDIFISHSHFDHWLGLPYLLFGRNVEALAQKGKRAAPVNIVIDKQLADVVADLLKKCHPDIGTLSYDLNFTDVTSCLSDTAQLSGFALQAFEVLHSVKTFGCRINTKSQRSIAYSSDTLPSPSFIKACAGADCLIHEGMVPDSDGEFASRSKHSTFRQAAEVANKIGAKSVFMTHIRPDYFRDKVRIEADLTRQCGIKIVIPNEGELITLW